MKNTKNQGYSLVEIMIAMLIGLSVVFLLLKLFQTASESTSSSQNRLSIKNDLSLISSNLSKALSGETRFYAFSGIASPERRFFRMFIPLAAMGRDLSTGPEYSNDMSFMYVGYDRNITPTVKGVCSDNPPNYNRVLLDQSDDTFGAWSVAGKVITVTPSGGYPGGTITVEDKLQFSLFNAPQATMWVATGDIQALPGGYYTQNPADGTFNGAGGTPPSECLNGFREIGTAPGGQKLYDLDQLYFVPMRPFVLNVATGGTSGAVSSTDLKAALANTPYRFFPTEVRTLGPQNEMLGGVNIKTFGITRCNVSGVDTIQCPTTILNAGPIQSSRLEADYKVDLQCTPPRPPGTFRYELRKTTMPASDWCPGIVGATAPCVVLPVPDFPTLSYAVTDASGGCTVERESLDNLDSTVFTLIKQDVLSGFNFWIKTAEGKDEHVQISFPD